MNPLSSSDLIRYSRQLNLSEFTLESQTLLKNTSVLVIGAGGLGCPVLMYLAAAGIGHIGIVDDDKVELHNLHRQVLYSSDDLGKPKADVAAHEIRKMNPEVQVTIHKERLVAGNAEQIIEPYDIIADGTDNFSSRYLINDCCVKLGKVNVFASILRFEGQLSVFNLKAEDGAYGPNYRDIYLTPPDQGMIPSCEEAGVLGPVAGTMASLQANEIIKIASGIGTSLSGKMMHVNLLDMDVLKLKIPKNALNRVRYENRDLINLSDIEGLCGVRQNSDILQISVEMLHRELQDGNCIALFDIREEDEYAKHNIGATNIPMQMALDNANLLDSMNKVVIHCQTGQRSQQLIQSLKDKGFEKPLYNLEGGLIAWTSIYGKMTLDKKS